MRVKLEDVSPIGLRESIFAALWSNAWTIPGDKVMLVLERDAVWLMSTDEQLTHAYILGMVPLQNGPGKGISYVAKTLADCYRQLRDY